MIEFFLSHEDVIAIMERELNASREHRRMTFIFKSSPRLYQKIVLRQLIEANEKRKRQSINRLVFSFTAE